MSFNLLKRGRSIRKTHFFYDTILRQSWVKHQNIYSDCMGEKLGLGHGRYLQFFKECKKKY